MNAMKKILEVTHTKAELGRLCGVSRALAHYWTKANRIPPEHLLTIERATGVDVRLMLKEFYSSQ